METVYFYSPGSCSLVGIVALEQLGLPYKLCRAEGDARQSPAFRKINPQGKVPALLVDGVPLCEVSAVLMHLAARAPEKAMLAAPGSRRYDLENQWLSYLGSGFHAAFYPWFRPQRYVTDEALVENAKTAAKEQIRSHYAFIEGELAGKKFLLGDETSIFDVYLYAMARWGKRIFDLPSEFPAVHAHLARVEQDPAVQFAIAIEKQLEASSPTGAFAGHVPLAG